MAVLQVSEQFNIFEYFLSIPHIDGYIRDRATLTATTCFEYDVLSW